MKDGWCACRTSIPLPPERFSDHVDCATGFKTTHSTFYRTTRNVWPMSVPLPLRGRRTGRRMNWVWFTLFCFMCLVIDVVTLWIVLRIVVQPMMRDAVKAELKRRDAVLASMLRHPSARRQRTQSADDGL